MSFSLSVVVISGAPFAASKCTRSGTSKRSFGSMEAALATIDVNTSGANVDSLFRFTWQGHLAGTTQVIEQVARFLVAQRREQTFRHHRKLALLQRLDFVAGQGERFGLGDDGHRFVVLLSHERSEAAAVLHFQRR